MAMAEFHTWTVALREIPTAHLKECAYRALQAKRSGYILDTDGVLRAWDDYRETLKRLAEAHANEETKRLMAGHGTFGRMGKVEWRRRNNLGDNYKLGMPWPLESELAYREPKPQVELRQPSTLDDARWTRGTKTPWERAPSEDAPEVREKVKLPDGRTVRIVWWITSCRGDECPGYYEEHTGIDGGIVTLKSCPYHWQRWEGQVPAGFEFTRYIAPEADPVAEDYATEQDTRAMWQGWATPEAEESEEAEDLIF